MRFYLNGSKLALENSEMLAKEAKLLIDNGYYARGFALSLLSLEESAKSFLLRLISLDIVDENKTLEFVSGQRQSVHKNKLKQSSLILWSSSKLIKNLIESIKKDQKYRGITPVFDIFGGYKEKFKERKKLSAKIAEFQQKKNKSFYVDVREGKISVPAKMVKKEEAEKVLEIIDLQMAFVKSVIEIDKSAFMSAWDSDIMSQLKIEDLLKAKSKS